MNIVNVGYDSTNYYILDAPKGKLLVDSGWPGTLPKLSAALKRKDMALDEVRHLMVTHFHPDHAGLTQELKGLGANLILLESQGGHIEPLNELFRAKGLRFVEISPQGSFTLKFDDSRAYLASLGITGEIIPTPGHSDDSVTLILDEGAAFTGDLQPRFMLPDDDQTSRESWDRIYQHQITRIFPGHGGG